MGLTRGAVAYVRSRQYLVEDVQPGTEPWESPLVRLSCLADDAIGEPLEVLWDHELDARVIDPGASWAEAGRKGYDDPRLFSAYLNTLRWNCVTATDPKLFQAPYRAGIEVKAFQLEPLRKALLMPRVNLFIADDVGLGKTIEAGLILRELIMRQRVRRVVVCCPPSVVTQWKEEMEQRFGLTFAVYDRAFVARTREERGYAVNPWSTHTRFILSHALLRDEAYAAPLRSWLGAFAHEAILILDEAHNAAPASGSLYAIDSHLTQAVRDVAPLFEHRLFLSATPHNGHSNSFAALLEVLDPQRFCRGVPVKSPKLLDDVMVRRLKQDLREVGEEFPRRHVEPVVLKDVPPTAPELILSTLLAEYRRLTERRLEAAEKRRRAAAMLVHTSLQKRLLSSIDAFARTLAIHRKSVVRATAEAPAEPDLQGLLLLLEPPGRDDVRSDLPEAEVEAEEDAKLASASAATGGVAASLAAELKVLDQMAAIAGEARYQPDARIRWLLGWIRANQCPDLGAPGARWNERRLLIFTEYTDTKRYLETQLESALESSDRGAARLGAFHGGMGEERREAIKAAFNADPAHHPLRILIATDAAREGVNLQNHCADLLHFDVPWNPSRMEQRNGRIDRQLQRAQDVWCRYFVLPGRAEDRVLDVLVRKIALIHEELGSLTPVVSRKVEGLLERGIRHDEESALRDRLERLDASAAEANGSQAIVREELEALRNRHAKLREQLTVLGGMLREAKDWIGLDVRHFKDALSAALLATAGTELEALASPSNAFDPDTARYVLPHLHGRPNVDPTWSATLDTLRVPRKKGQSEAEWRRDAPIRPVVFRDPRNLDGEVVHLHLEHRLVKRLLGRFLAQGFVTHDLKRVCLVRTEDPVPRVLVLGRLSLYGEHAARLHDQVITVAADWEDPAARGRRKLRSLGVGETSEVHRLLDEALATPRLREVPETIRAMLLAGVANDVADLRGALEKRAEAVSATARRELGERGEREAREMRRILLDSQKRIRARAAEVDRDYAQFTLDFGEGDRRQLEADRSYWPKRLAQLEKEVESEPARIRTSYDVRAERVEPVGVVYLWPVSR
ncbi:MAG: DEAD/DEAH box helicase [Planctomycetes bacterium]|nr:DEAD/DEAH box helicase [Planctomycetota bacterium]